MTEARVRTRSFHQYVARCLGFTQVKFDDEIRSGSLDLEAQSRVGWVSTLQRYISETVKDTAYRSQSFVGNHIHARFMCDFNNSMSMSIYELSICAQKSIILNEIERPKNAATIAMFVLSKVSMRPLCKFSQLQRWRYRININDIRAITLANRRNCFCGIFSDWK